MSDGSQVIGTGVVIAMDLTAQVRVLDGASHPPYAGPYSATPTVDGLTLPTAGRSMAEDVTVEPIPIGFVSNASGGTTATIG